MRAPRRRPRVVSLGLWLLRRQPLVLAGLVLAAIGATAAAAITLQARPEAAIHAPAVAAVASAWSVGIVLAFGGALRAIPRDAQDGVLALVRARGVRTRSYAFGRTFALAAIVAIGVGGVTVVAGACAMSGSRSVLPALRATCGGLAYCAAFSATIAPVAMAALSPKSRFAGYLSFLAVLVLPELAGSSTAGLFPSGWRELTSIPAALEAVRAGVESPRSDGLHALRALAVLAALVAIASAIVGSRAAREQARWPG